MIPPLIEKLFSLISYDDEMYKIALEEQKTSFEDENDISSEWNIRKAAVTTFCAISNKLKNEFLNIYFPIVTQKFIQSNNNKDWKVYYIILLLY